jgi:hypothetical protein
MRPHTLIAVGRKGEAALLLMRAQEFRVIRHPSHGGKSEFIAGLKAAGIL